MIYHVLTWFGTLLVYNAELDRFEHRDFGFSRSDTSAVELDLPIMPLLLDEAEAVECELKFGERSRRRIGITSAGGHSVNLSIGGKFLAALPDGHLCLKEKADGWERFVLVRPETCEALSLLRRFSWVMMPEQQLIRRSAIDLLDGWVLKLGERRIALNGAELAVTILRDRKAVVINHGGWRVLSLILFNPVIHYVAFGGDAAFELLDLSMEAAVRVGEYEGSFLLSTDRPNHRAVVPNTVHVEHRRYNRFIDYCSARYQYEPWFVQSDFQPVLYLDTDVVVDRPITEFLIDALCSASIEVSEESFSPLATRTSVGSELLRDDGRKPGNQGGFNSGAIAFPSFAMAAPVFSAILRAMRRYGDDKTAPSLTHFDQAIANYVGFALDSVSTRAFHNRMRNYFFGRFDGAEHAVGFVHFWGAEVPRINVMRRYLRELENRGATALPDDGEAADETKAEMPPPTAMQTSRAS